MKINQWLAVTSVAAAICLGAAQGLAQDNGGGNGGGNNGGGGGNGGGRGFRNRDPQQMRQFIMDQIRETLEVKDDAEWTASDPPVQKVTDVRREVGAGMGRMFFRGGRGGGPGGFFNQTPSPETDALQKAIDAKASSSEMKAAMAKFAEYRKTKQAELEKAQ